MFRRTFIPFILTCVISSDLIMASQVSLGRLFPASRNRQRASSLISHAIESSFFKRPPFQPPKPMSKGTIKSLPSFPDVLWKFNKKLINNNIFKVQNKSIDATKVEAPDLLEHFSKFSNLASMMAKNGNSKLKGPNPSILENDVMAESQRNEVRLKINKINEEEMKIQKQFTTRGTTTQAPPAATEKNKFAGVTNSPIFYIQLPAAPYEFHPSLGYISRPASPDLSNFLRPQIDFLNNGRPTKIFQPVTPISLVNETDAFNGLTDVPIEFSSFSPTSEVAPTTEKITSTTTEDITTSETITTPFTTESSTNESTPPLSTLPSTPTTPSTSTLSTLPSTPTTPSTSTPMVVSSTTELETTPSIAPESLATKSTILSSSSTIATDFDKNVTTITTEIPSTTVKGGYTNSPITWLKGPYIFNGRPNNLFIYKSPPNKADRFDYLHKLYSKPGVYL